MRNYFAVLFCLFYSCLAYSVDSGLDDRLLTLSQSRAWLALGVYKESRFGRSGYKSEVLSKGFFLSPGGAENPYAELVATLDAFNARDQAAVCLYRGRLAWLRQSFKGDHLWLADIECAEFDEWSSGGDASLSVMFASGYFKNPASYYGHLFLKVNKAKHGLDVGTVNYGAKVPDDENLVLYILKGLTGLYKATYTTNQYYSNVNTYSEVELRDMWEYELNLSGFERQLVLGHAWELLKFEYSYLFLSKNCVYRIAELLGAAGYEDAYRRTKYWVTPQDLIQSLSRYEKEGRSLISESRYIPSRQSRLYFRYGLLSMAERVVLKQVVGDLSVFDKPLYLELEQASKYRIVDTLIEYYKFLEISKISADESLKGYNRALLARYQLEPSPDNVEFDSSSRPDKGRNSSYFSVGTLRAADSGRDGLAVSIRPAYYDALDGDHGHVRGSSLKMGELKVSLFDDRFSIDQISIAEVQSIQVDRTDLYGDKSFSWSVALMGKRKNLACRQCLGFYGFGEAGFSGELLLDRLVASVFVGGGFNDTGLREDSVFFSAAAQFSGVISSRAQLFFRAEYRDYINADTRDGEVLQFVLRSPLSLNNDIRLYYEYDVEGEFGFSFGRYW